MAKKTAPRRKIQPIVSAVVQPVTRRLSRMEDLLLEMRNEQDVQLKQIAGIQQQLDALTDQVRRRSQPSVKRPLAT
jgi:hypothetical protein